MSSRNRYLTPAEREIAPNLHKTLLGAKERVESGDHDYAAIERSGVRSLEAAGFAPQYLSIVDASDAATRQRPSRELVIVPPPGSARRA